MHKKLLALIVGAVVLASGSAALAATKTTKTTKVGGTMYASISKITGAKATITGFSQDKNLGTSLFIFKDIGFGNRVKDPVTLYTAKGSISGTSVSNIIAASNGNVTISDGTFTVKSGTEAFKNVTGKVTFSGTRAANSTYTINYQGSLKVKR